MNITTAQFANLYSWYSWPNVVLPVVGGFLMDRVLGIRFGTMLFAFIICIGQAIFSLGGFLDRLWVMEIGRFVFGIGGESLAVAQNTYAVSWFKGKELNMVFGFQLSVARVGSTVNFLLMGPLFEWISDNIAGEDGPSAIGWTLLFAGSSCLMSFCCSLVLAWMDRRRSSLLGIQEPGDSGEVVKISDVKTFPVAFWFLSFACLAYYGAIFPFVSLAQVPPPLLHLYQPFIAGFLRNEICVYQSGGE
jgi:MFS family permease